MKETLIKNIYNLFYKLMDQKFKQQSLDESSMDTKISYPDTKTQLQKLKYTYKIKSIENILDSKNTINIEDYERYKISHK